MNLRTHQALLWAAIATMTFFANANAEAADVYSKATKIGPAKGLTDLGCKGGFPDIEGKCWKCPSGYKHDNILLAPTNNKVCKDEGGRENRKGDYKGKATGLLKTDCPSGQWWSSHDNGCYKCDSGFKHDILKKGNESGVCWRDKTDKFSAAERMSGNVFCDQGGFLDLIEGGTCWKCPSATPKRTTKPVNGTQACMSEACGKKDGRPCLITERVPSCDAGLAEDFIANKCVPDHLKIAACKALVTALRAGGNLPEQMKAVLEPANAKKNSQTRTKAQWAEKLIVDAVPIEPFMDDVKDLWKKANANKAQLMAVFHPDTFCTPGAVDPKLVAAGMRKAKAMVPGLKKVSFTEVQLRDPRIYMSFGISGQLAAGVAAQFGLSVVTDFQGNVGTYVTVGPAIVTNLSLGDSIGVGVFPHSKLADFEGWGFAWGGSFGPPGKPFSGGADMMYSDKMIFQGGGFNGAIGLGALPADMYFGAGHTWKIWSQGQ